MKRSELKSLIREAVEEVMNEFAPLGVANEERLDEKTPPNFPSALKKKIFKQYGQTPKAYATMWTLSKKMDEGDTRVCEMWTAWEEKSINEKLDPHADASVWIKDFQDSDDPKFSGKSKDKRKEMALGAYYAARRKAGLKTEDYDPDQAERDEYDRKIAKHNEKNPQRHECPTCKTPDALSSWEKKKGYQCKSCADSEEGLYENKNLNPEQSEEHDETDMSNPEENKEVELAKKIKSLADELLNMHGVEAEESEEGEKTEEKPTDEKV